MGAIFYGGRCSIQALATETDTGARVRVRLEEGEEQRQPLATQVRPIGLGLHASLPDVLTQMALDVIGEMPWERNRRCEANPEEPYWDERRVAGMLRAVLDQQRACPGFVLAAFGRGEPEPIGLIVAQRMDEGIVRTLTERQGEYEVVVPWFDARLRDRANIGVISWVLVAQPHRGRKVGQQLMLAAYRRLGMLGMTHVVIEADWRNARWVEQCKRWQYERVYSSLDGQALMYGRALERV